jgi:gluconate 5-dehydrogenase
MIQELFNLTGKTALVTGATHGLGMAIAGGLAGAGARIVVNDIFQEKLEKAKAEYTAGGIEVKTYLFDVTNEEQVKSFIPKIEAEVAPIDILVNNAGIIKRIPFLEMEAKDFTDVIDVDLTGPFIMCSMMSELGRNTVSGYAAAKGGLKMLTRNLATELARYNIQVNGIGPGYYATDQTAPIRVGGHPFNEFIINRTPAGRWGQPEELQGAAIFLASRASDFVNGHVLYVDGGILATLGKPANEN